MLAGAQGSKLLMMHETVERLAEHWFFGQLLALLTTLFSALVGAVGMMPTETPRTSAIVAGDMFAACSFTNLSQVRCLLASIMTNDMAMALNGSPWIALSNSP